MGGVVKSIGKATGNIVGGLLGLKPVQQPEAPPPPQPVTAPAAVPDVAAVPDQATAAANVDLAAQQADAQDAERKKKGRASTVLTGERGAGTPITASKTLLGD